MAEWTKGAPNSQEAPPWTKVSIDPQTASPSQDLSLEPTTESSRERERPVSVTAMAVFEWLKAALFAQLFWNLWSISPHSSATSAENLSGGAAPNYSVFLLLAVALYLVVLGWGIWNLRKWALLLILLVWFSDLAYDLSPESLGLQHAADLWLGDQSLFLFVGITIADIIAFMLFANRETYRAFNAEDEAKILWWIFWWT